jgi:hypothetical protein
MEFIDAKSRGDGNAISKNKDIKKVYDILQVISKDEKDRVLLRKEISFLFYSTILV